MYCPECGSGYRDGFTRCEECNVDLVATLPPEPDHSGEFVPVASVEGQLHVSQIVSFLESNGIPAIEQGESTRNIYGFTVDGLAAAQVLVRKEQAVEAARLLKEADHGDLLIDSEEVL